MAIRSILRPFDHPLGLRRSCSEEWSVLGGCGWFDLIVGRPCSPLSRLISSRRRWFSAWATRRSVMTSSSRLSSCLTSSRARSSAMLFRSRSSSMSSLAPGEGDGAYQKLLCSLSSTVATCLGACCHAQIIEEIRYDPSCRCNERHTLSAMGSRQRCSLLRINQCAACDCLVRAGQYLGRHAGGL